ncbi:ribosome maturation factor RimP [Ferrimonas lipolytica]|uniref:Ribosome maturation factor RimP n=1 Tax=Ferrimonas lipolytica TaxID=2724191 RepID=A0A6H1UA65_9GAMM|nr:ribosome maturation factor RimP [Ferrimonas lipolytica]QIZ75924.1 ribosome maturation factor RimP [Ferrimonas lipolytica]
MATIQQRLTEMLAEPVEMLGYELWGLQFISAGNHSILRLFIDHADGISVQACADVSRQVSAVLDVEDPISTEFNLEVSSPGMDRPLFTAEHYQKYLGSDVNVVLNMPMEGKRKWRGEIIAVDGDNISLRCDGQEQTLILSNVQKSNLIPKF